jgi:mannose-6-phosphate isomerase-like protein (cupin superfamily)
LAIIPAAVVERSNVVGAEHGATISVIVDHSGPGEGPRLHRHPYDETWLVQEGTLTFQLGDERFTVGPGDVVIAPPNTPHKFTNDGSGRSSLVCIHASPEFSTEWLE